MSGREQYEFFAEARPFMDHVALFMRQGQYVATNIKMERRVEGMVIEPMITLSRAEMQGLANALWHAGIRPHAASDKSGETGAINHHLQDMRKIAFKQLKMEGDL